MVYPVFSSFVKADYEILTEKFSVEKYQYKHKKNIFSHLMEQIKLFFFLLFNFGKFDFVYVWFADYHSLLPIIFSKLSGKKSLLVLGGYDVTFIPQFNYGSFNNPIRAFFAKNSMKYAWESLAVSDNILEEAKQRVPQLNGEILYTGYSSEKFRFGEGDRKREVVSVIGGNTYKRMMIKGVDLIVETAKLLPEIKFILIDLNEEIFEKNFGTIENVEIIKAMPQSELIKYFQNASVYAQFSLREGLPNSVCEAMLCGAIPVGPNAGGIPIAIGECGFIINERNADAAAKAILDALNSSDELRKCARQRVIENFSFEKREERLLKLIEEN